MPPLKILEADMYLLLQIYYPPTLKLFTYPSPLWQTVNTLMGCPYSQKPQESDHNSQILVHSSFSSPVALALCVFWGRDVLESGVEETEAPPSGLTLKEPPPSTGSVALASIMNTVGFTGS